MELAWKENWEETKQNFTKWWKREGLVLGGYKGTVTEKPHEDMPVPAKWPAMDTA